MSERVIHTAIYKYTGRRGTLSEQAYFGRGTVNKEHKGGQTLVKWGRVGECEEADVMTCEGLEHESKGSFRSKRVKIKQV